MAKLTKLEFYQNAKEFFIQNPVNEVYKGQNAYALCGYLNHVNIGDRNLKTIESEIAAAIGRNKHSKDPHTLYNSVYFLNNRARLRFINNQIKKYSQNG